MNDIRDDLKAFLDGELSPERAAEVQAALNADPELQQEAETMKLLGFEIKRLAAEPMVSGRAETMAALRGPEKRRWNPRFALNAVGAVLLVGVVGVVFFPVFAKTGNMAAESATPATIRNSLPDGPIAGAEGLDDNLVFGSTGGTTGGTGGADSGLQRPTDASPSTDGFVGGNLERQKGEVPSQPDETESSTPAFSIAPDLKTLPPDLNNRMVVKNGSLGVRVKSVNEAMNQATTITSGLGGFVTSSNRSGSDSTEAAGSMTLRVPSKQFETAIKRLSALGEVTDGPNLSGDDVTVQYADLNARIKVLKAEEDSLITMLRAARRVNEMLAIKERLTGVRSELDSMAAQAKALKDLSSMSSLSVTFEQLPKVGQATSPSDPFGEAWVNAVNGLRAAGTWLGQVGINLFVYAPIWLPIAIILGVWYKRARRVA